MPDLSTKSVHKFWHEYKDKSIYRVINFLEGVENWTLDGNPEIEEAIARLSTELDNLSKVDMEKLAQQELIIAIANSLKSGRTLRLLHILDSAHPGSASKLLIYAEENSKTPDDGPGLFLRRNIVFERLRLLSRVFGEERIKFVLKAIEGEEHE